MARRQNRIDRMFARLASERRSAFATYTVACDPSFDESLDRLRQLVANGIDLIEIGHPYSDPILDGATIQAANRRALGAGGNLARTLDLCAAFRTEDATTPLVLMGYANPILAMGYETFANRAASAGIDGLIVADMPLREAEPLLAAIAPRGIVMIPLAAPNLSPVDFVSDRNGVGGFLYCIPVVGPTGGPSAPIEVIADAVQRCRDVSSLPVMVGFGVKTAEMAAAIARIADGVIVATALIDQFESLRKSSNAGDFHQRAGEAVATIRQAIDR